MTAEDSLIEVYQLGERMRREATLVRITLAENRCAHACDARLQRIEYQGVGRVLVVEKCPTCAAETRAVVPLPHGMTVETTRTLPPMELLARLSGAEKAL